MLIKLKRLKETAKLPTQVVGDVGFDLYACEPQVLPAGRVALVDTGLAIADYDPSYPTWPGNVIESPEGTTFISRKLTVYPKIEGRSSLGLKGVFPIAGIVDPPYRGSLRVTLANLSGDDYTIQPCDRIAQLVFYTCLVGPELIFEETDVLSMTARGANGFGSTGR